MLLMLALLSFASGIRSMYILWPEGDPSLVQGTPVYVRTADGMLIHVGELQAAEDSTEVDGHLTPFRYDSKAGATLRKGAVATLEALEGQDERSIILTNRIPDARRVEEGDVIDGSLASGWRSSSGLGPRVLTRDWKLTAVLGLGAMAFILLLLHVTKLMLRLVAFSLCCAGGSAGAIFLPGSVHRALTAVLPADLTGRLRIDMFSYVIAFLVGYVVVLFVVGILSRPLKVRKKPA